MIRIEEECVLENDVVRLSPLNIEDYEHLVHFSIQEPDLWYFSLMQANSPEKMKLYIENAIEERTKKHSYPFVVFDKRSGQYAGCTRFYDIQPDYATLQLGYTWYGKNFQGTGLNKHCKYLLLEFAFEKWNVERVEFRADNDNKRSIRAMKAIGCVEEGILRSNMYKPDGTRRDSIVLSILKEEWHASVKTNLLTAMSNLKFKI